jgi:outer membrane protein insertion porin family
MNEWLWRFGLASALIISAAACEASAQTAATISHIEFAGNRRVKSDTVRSLIFTRPGDPYCARCLQADLQALERNPNFENVRLDIQDDPSRANAKIVIFNFTDRLVIRRIDYRGLQSVTQSDVLNCLRDRKVNLSIEGLFNPTEVDKAQVAIRELLADHGHPAATVSAAVEQLEGTNAIKIELAIDEGPSASK